MREGFEAHIEFFSGQVAEERGGQGFPYPIGIILPGEHDAAALLCGPRTALFRGLCGGVDPETWVVFRWNRKVRQGARTPCPSKRESSGFFFVCAAAGGKDEGKQKGKDNAHVTRGPTGPLLSVDDDFEVSENRLGFLLLSEEKGDVRRFF